MRSCSRDRTKLLPATAQHAAARGMTPSRRPPSVSSSVVASPPCPQVGWLTISGHLDEYGNGSNDVGASALARGRDSADHFFDRLWRYRCSSLTASITRRMSLAWNRG